MEFGDRISDVEGDVLGALSRADTVDDEFEKLIYAVLVTTLPGYLIQFLPIVMRVRLVSLFSGRNMHMTLEYIIPFRKSMEML